MARGFGGQHGESMPLPGERSRGLANRYRDVRAALTTPTLPIRLTFRNALPATFIPLHQGIGTAKAGIQHYTGLAPSKLFPMIEVREPFED